MTIGVWGPTDKDELQAAEQAALYPVVIGYSVGNEGLNMRYDLKTLVLAMERLRRATGKPSVQRKKSTITTKTRLCGRSRTGSFPTSILILWGTVIPKRL